MKITFSIMILFYRYLDLLKQLCLKTNLKEKNF